MNVRWVYSDEFIWKSSQRKLGIIPPKLNRWKNLDQREESKRRRIRPIKSFPILMKVSSRALVLIAWEKGFVLAI